MLNSEVPEVPTVKAFTPGAAILKKRPYLSQSWLVLCPHCDRVHIHGASEGRRVSHCPSADGPHAYEFEGRTRPDAYTLIHAGEIDDAEVFETAWGRTAKKANAYFSGFSERDRARCNVRNNRAAQGCGSREVT